MDLNRIVVAGTVYR